MHLVRVLCVRKVTTTMAHLSPFSLPPWVAVAATYSVKRVFSPWQRIDIVIRRPCQAFVPSRGKLKRIGQRFPNSLLGVVKSSTSLPFIFWGVGSGHTHSPCTRMMHREGRGWCTLPSLVCLHICEKKKWVGWRLSLSSSCYYSTHARAVTSWHGPWCDFRTAAYKERRASERGAGEDEEVLVVRPRDAQVAGWQARHEQRV